jgi:pyruvate-formate lyase-activating enzyme
MPGTLKIFDVKEGIFTGDSVYYSLPKYKKYINGKENNITKTIRDLLSESVQKYILPKVPTAISLSGGIDSSAVAALFKRYYDGNVVAYCASVGDSKRRKGDLYYSRKVAEHLNIELREIILEEDYVKENVDRSIWISEFSDWRQIANALMHEAVANAAKNDGFKVLLSGDGVDSVFATYPYLLKWYENEKFDEQRRKLINGEYKAGPIRCYNSSMHGGPVAYYMPFLYPPLIEYCINLDPIYKEYKGQSKYFFRAAFKKYLPKEVVFRQKVVMQKGGYSDKIFKVIGKEELQNRFNKIFFGQQNSFSLSDKVTTIPKEIRKTSKRIKKRLLIQLPYEASTNNYPRYFPYPLNLMAIRKEGDTLFDMNLKCFKKKRADKYAIIDLCLKYFKKINQEFILNCGDYPPDGDKWEYFEYFIRKLNKPVTIYGPYLLFESRIQALERENIKIKRGKIFNDWHDVTIPLFMIEKYPNVSGKRKVNINLTQGCPRKCLYCPTWPIYKRSYNIFPIEETLEKIYDYYKTNVRFFNFIDDNISAHPKTFYKFLKALKTMIKEKKMKGVQFQSQEGLEIGALAHLKICQLLKETNWTEVKVGMENINPDFLKTVNKPHADKLHLLDKTLANIKETGLKVTAYYLLGLNENKKDIMKNLKFIAKHKLGLRINILRPYEGTKYTELPVNKSLSDKDLKKYKSLGYAIAWLGFEKGINAFDKKALSQILKKFKLDYKKKGKEHIFTGKVNIGFATSKLIKILHLVLKLNASSTVKHSKKRIIFYEV